MSTHKFEKLFYSFALIMIITVTFYSQNPIQVENARTDGVSMDWMIDTIHSAKNNEIEGYASATSVNKGEFVRFYVNTRVNQTVHLDIYRLGYYGGSGARFIQGLHSAWVGPKPYPIPDLLYGLAECDWPALPNQQIHQQWLVPPDAVSGVYIVKLTGLGTIAKGGGNLSSYISFVVRDDARVSDLLFQRSVTTDQAYNNYPSGVQRNVTPSPTPIYEIGKSLYRDDSSGDPLPGLPPTGSKQARKVSFNRPYAYKGSIYDTAGGTLFKYDYNFLRWLEKGGYDVSYCTDIDIDAISASSSSGILAEGRHKALISGGHSEYWSWNMRDNAEKARDRPSQAMDLGFFGGNDVYWQIRLEESSGAGTTPASVPKRTIVAYKETAIDTNLPDQANDPIFNEGPPELKHTVTSLWRNNVLNGGSMSKPPEDELVGVMSNTFPLIFLGGNSNDFYLADDCPDWIKAGMTGKPLEGLVGYEADSFQHNYPSRSTTVDIVGDSPFYPANGGPPLGNSNMTFYTNNSNNAHVFAAGTIQWAWGLDNWGADPALGVVLRPQYQREEAQVLTSNVLSCILHDVCS